MSKTFGLQAHRIDSAGISLCHRPRLYWVDWELKSGEGAAVTPPGSTLWGNHGSVELTGVVAEDKFLEAGWMLTEGHRLPTFTTSRPRDKPGYRPAGLDRCAAHERARWEADDFRFPPYQYRDHNVLWNKKGLSRRPSASEREAIMGIPVGYTKPCLPKALQKGAHWDDVRMTLIGNSWNVGVIVWLLEQLLGPLFAGGKLFKRSLRTSAQEGVRASRVLLLRPPLNHQGRLAQTSEGPLLRKLFGLVSMKGEDLMVQSSTEPQVKFHRLRSSVPGKLWRWREVAGWRWKRTGEHINLLELRAILTTLRWLVVRKGIRGRRFVRLTDSLVCLHALSRGRSSSRKHPVPDELAHACCGSSPHLGIHQHEPKPG